MRTDIPASGKWLLPVSFLSILLCLPSTPARGYEAAELASTGSLTGRTLFHGDPPEPLFFKLRNFPNERYCRKISDGRGNRIVQEVRVNGDGVLQDAVIYFPDIKRGKPIIYDGTDVMAQTCQFLIQGAPSVFTGVVMRNNELRLDNEDSDPSDPKLMMGIAHNPHSFEISGFKIRTLFKMPLTTKGQVIRKKIVLKSDQSFVKLECDLHDFMEAYFLPVENPYYAVVDKSGKFTIDGIPPGVHKVLAWHPILGKVEREVTIVPGKATPMDFVFGKEKD